MADLKNIADAMLVRPFYPNLENIVLPTFDASNKIIILLVAAISTAADLVIKAANLVFMSATIIFGLILGGLVELITLMYDKANVFLGYQIPPEKLSILMLMLYTSIFIVNERAKTNRLERYVNELESAIESWRTSVKLNNDVKISSLEKRLKKLEKNMSLYD